MPKTTYTRKLEKMLEDKQTVEGEQPLAFLVSVYQNNRNKLELRVEAAKAACVYVHRKMPVAVEHSLGPDISGIVMQVVGPKRAEASCCPK